MSSVTLKGNSIEIGGQFPYLGDAAPAFSLTAQDLSDKGLSDFPDQKKVLNIIPSVDTGICATSTRRFNQEAADLDGVVVLVVSADLPFAAARFCGAEGLENVVTLSTFRHPEFRRNYGVAIDSGPMAGLCARAVLVLDENDQVLHAELVSEIAQEPDYEAALAALKG